MRRTNWLPYVLLTLTVLFWSGNFVIGRGIRESIPPVSLNFWRWVGALTLLMPLGVPRAWAQRRLLRQHWRLVAVLSLPAITIFNAFIYTALQTTTAINTVLVNAMIPIFIVIIAWLAFEEKLASRQVIGILVSLTGLLFIVTRGDLMRLRSLALSTGDLWTLGAALAWAVYSVMLRKRPPQMDPIAFLTLLIACGLCLALPWYLWELSQAGGFEITAPTMATLVYVTLFPSVLAYIFWNYGIARVGASRAGIFVHLMPVFSILLAVTFLGEHLQRFHLVGIGLVFTGIALTTMAR